jgi:hypothetical protein
VVFGQVAAADGVFSFCDSQLRAGHHEVRCCWTPILMIDGISQTPVSPPPLRRGRFAQSSVDDDDVSGAAGPVPAELPELAGFRDNTRAGERGVVVN